MTPWVEVGSEEGGVAWIKSIIRGEQAHKPRSACTEINNQGESTHRPISTQSTVTHWAITTMLMSTLARAAAEYLHK